MAIRYTTNIEDLDYDEMIRFKDGDGEKHDKKWYVKLLKGAALVVAAFDGDRMIGFVRVFGDGMIWLMVVGLRVHPDYRRRGIATELMRRVIKFAKKNKYQTVRLFAATDEDKGLFRFYKKIGFERMDNAMRSKDMEW